MKVSIPLGDVGEVGMDIDVGVVGGGQFTTMS